MFLKLTKLSGVLSGIWSSSTTPRWDCMIALEWGELGQRTKVMPGVGFPHKAM